MVANAVVDLTLPIIAILLFAWMAKDLANDLIVVRQPRGAARLWLPLKWFALASILAVPLLVVVSSAFDPKLDTSLANSCAISAVVTVFIICRAIEARGRARPSPRREIQTSSYLGIAGSLVLAHVGLVSLYLGLSSTLPPLSIIEWFAAKALLALIFFVLTQMTTAWAVRCLAVSVYKDWLSEGRIIARRKQYRLVAGPLVTSAAISVFAGPLLVGVLSQLVLLWLTWRFTHESPATPVQMFLSLVKTSRPNQIPVDVVLLAESRRMSTMRELTYRDRIEIAEINARSLRPFVSSNISSREQE